MSIPYRRATKPKLMKITDSVLLSLFMRDNATSLVPVQKASHHDLSIQGP